MVGNRAQHQSTDEHDETSQLLLYVAGELSDAETSAMDRRVASDAALREQVEMLRATQMNLGARFAAADAAEPIESTARAAERMASRAMRQWQVDRLARAKSGEGAGENVLRVGKVRRVPIWLYPLSAAAGVLLMLGVWSLALREVAPPLAVNPAIIDDNGSEAVASVGDMAIRSVAAADDEELGVAGADEAMLADTGWNPLSDVGGESLATLEREYQSFQVMEYSMHRSAERTP